MVKSLPLPQRGGGPFGFKYINMPRATTVLVTVLIMLIAIIGALLFVEQHRTLSEQLRPSYVPKMVMYLAQRK